jgi:putative hemolysin
MPGVVFFAVNLRTVLLTSPGLARLHRLQIGTTPCADPFALAARALQELEVSVELLPADETRIPRTGALVVAANHPFGGLDGLIAIATIGQRRRDLRVLGNRELTSLAGIGSLVIPVDPSGTRRATRANVAAVRTALKWLRAGGALLIFPAGEVSSLDLRTLAVIDRQWSATAARLIRVAHAQVVLMHFAGSNSLLFQLAGMVHPRVRTLLLPHELGNKMGARVSVRVGEPLAAARVSARGSDEEIAARLRLTTYQLSHMGGAPAARASTTLRRPAPLIAPVEPQRIAREIEALPPEMLLLSCGRMRVYCAPAACIPSSLRELGRLRELTFRAAGEGTGHAADIDRFDEYYEHLFVWNAEQGEIVGAYRLGRTDLITRRFGRSGLYTSTLFDYSQLFLALLGPALELGRSFVRAEYQKDFSSLLLLWKGIAEYVGRHPHCCKLIGPVSISNDYGQLSRALVVEFLRRRRGDPLMAMLVRPRRPFRGPFSLRSLCGDPRSRDIEALSSLVAGLEPDGKSVPVLLRHYLRLGGRMLGFSIDPAFGNALDCLVMVDLRKTDPAVLRRYMSEIAWQRFARRHDARRQGARQAP